MYNLSLSPTPEVISFLALIQSGQTASAAAKQSGLNIHESILVRKMAGLPVTSPQKDIPEKVIALRSQGLKHKQIASALHTSQSNVNRILCLSRKQGLI